MLDGKMKSPVTTEIIERKIYLIRGRKVMLDSDLARLYGVNTKRLNEQVRRNADRFPEDFMFQLCAEEFEVLRSHFATSSLKHGGRRHLPFAFTEHGALMAVGKWEGDIPNWDIKSESKGIRLKK